MRRRRQRWNTVCVCLAGATTVQKTGYRYVRRALMSVFGRFRSVAVDSGVAFARALVSSVPYDFFKCLARAAAAALARCRRRARASTHLGEHREAGFSVSDIASVFDGLSQVRVVTGRRVASLRAHAAAAPGCVHATRDTDCIFPFRGESLLPEHAKGVVPLQRSQPFTVNDQG